MWPTAYNWYMKRLPSLDRPSENALFLHRLVGYRCWIHLPLSVTCMSSNPKFPTANSVSMKCAKWFISNIVESYPRRYSCGVLWTPSFQPSWYLAELKLTMSLLVIIFFCIWYMYTYSTQNIILQIFVGCDVVMVVKKIPINHLVEVTDCKATCPRWSQVKSPSSLISAFSTAILFLKMFNFTPSPLPPLSLSHRLFTDSEMEYFYSGCTLAVLLIIFMDSQFPVGFTCQAK